MIDFNSLQVGLEKNIEFSINPDQMQRFADLSGDYNPLHLNDSFAKEMGYSSRVVYGGLLVAKISLLVGMHLSCKTGVWSNLEISFVSPLYVNEKAVLQAQVTHVSDVARAFDVRFAIKKQNDVVARGKTMITVK